MENNNDNIKTNDYTELIEFLGDKFENIDKKFEHIDKKFEHIDKKFDEIDKRFDKTDEKINKAKQELMDYTDRRVGESEVKIISKMNAKFDVLTNVLQEKEVINSNNTMSVKRAGMSI